MQHLVREADCSLVGLLLGAHRPTDDELQLLDTEPLTQQPLLGDDVVADAHLAWCVPEYQVVMRTALSFVGESSHLAV